MTGWITSGITKAINAFFGGLVTSALNPLLRLLGHTLLTMPDPASLPRLGQLWENSRQIAVAAYALLILAAAVLVMAYETVQTRHSIKEIAPRIIVGFLAANTSLLLAGKAVAVANAVSTGVLAGGVDPTSAASALTGLVMNAVSGGGIFLVFLGIAIACVLLALLVGYVIRVAVTVILIAAAPLALMCHALPQTDGVARWWWRAFTGVLAIQLVQSLTLIAALNVFLTPGGFWFFGPTMGGLVNLIVTLALLYILVKIPFWILHGIHTGGGRSMIGSAIKGAIAYKTLGAVGLRGGHGASHRGGATGAGGGQRGPSAGGPTGSPRGRGPASGPHRGPSGSPSGAGARSVPRRAAVVAGAAAPQGRHPVPARSLSRTTTTPVTPPPVTLPRAATPHRQPPYRQPLLPRAPASSRPAHVAAPAPPTGRGGQR